MDTESQRAGDRELYKEDIFEENVKELGQRGGSHVFEKKDFPASSKAPRYARENGNWTAVKRARTKFTRRCPKGLTVALSNMEHCLFEH